MWVYSADLAIWSEGSKSTSFVKKSCFGAGSGGLAVWWLDGWKTRLRGRKPGFWRFWRVGFGVPEGRIWGPGGSVLELWEVEIWVSEGRNLGVWRSRDLVWRSGQAGAQVAGSWPDGCPGGGLATRWQVLELSES